MEPASAGPENPIRNVSEGLDRAAFNVYEHADRHVVAPLKANEPEEQAQTENDHGTAHSSARPLHSIVHLSTKLRLKAKVKTQELFRPSHETPSPPSSSTAPSLAPYPLKSSDDDRLYNPLPERKGLQAKDFLHNPVSTVQSALQGASGAKFAQVMDNQVVTHGKDVGMVRAWDKLGSVQNEEEKSDARDELEILKKERQDSYVRWTMDRHILKVRQSPPRTVEWPRIDDYKKADNSGRMRLQGSGYGQQLIRFLAERYCDHHIDESPQLPPANEEAINTSIERLLMTSMAYQTALMKLRHIYRWDDPYETAVFCSAYFLLSTTGYLGTGMILFLVFLVLRRSYRPPTLEGLREDIERSEDTEQTALSITQLIEQHGSHGWLDALIERLGPKFMLQLEDMADALEVMRNFYEWRNPYLTARALGVLSICLLLFVSCPPWLQIRGAQFSIGVMYFGIFPITSHSPQYRQLLSPFKWAFWRVPTDAEWAIARIQTEAREVTRVKRDGRGGGHEDNEESQSSALALDDDTEPSNIHIGKHHCTTKDQEGHLHHGHIHLTSKDVKFVTAVRSRTLWLLQWSDVSTMSKARTDNGLCFEDDREAKYKIESLKGRNELFTQIIGYSGLKWQVSG